MSDFWKSLGFGAPSNPYMTPQDESLTKSIMGMMTGQMQNIQNARNQAAQNMMRQRDAQQLQLNNALMMGQQQSQDVADKNAQSASALDTWMRENNKGRYTIDPYTHAQVMNPNYDAATEDQLHRYQLNTLRANATKENLLKSWNQNPLGGAGALPLGPPIYSGKIPAVGPPSREQMIYGEAPSPTPSPYDDILKRLYEIYK